MSGFTVSWLEAREPLDRASRSAALADRFAACLGERPRLLDLGSGTGANIRYLAPRLGRPQRWIALDHDPDLLEASARAFAHPAIDGPGAPGGDRTNSAVPRPTIEVIRQKAELSRLDGLPDLAEVDGVTASALLDLTSAAWLDDLAERLAAHARPALFALSFDGRMTFEPERPEDHEVRRRFVQHQGTDKGFGPALGPDAVVHLAGALESRGRTVMRTPSDWYLGPAHRTVTAIFLDGLAAVMAATAGGPLGPWLAARRDELRNGQLEVMVGHQDLLVL